MKATEVPAKVSIEEKSRAQGTKGVGSFGE